MTNHSYDVTVIGGGSAGMAAALSASTTDSRVLIIEGSTALGGNYYKPLPEGLAPDIHNGMDEKRRKTLQSRVQSLANKPIDIVYDQRVWSIFPIDDESTSARFRIHLAPLGSIETRSLILAVGVYDRMIPFSGWTLPGVIPPGGVQLLMKKQGILPGKRAIVAGTGPLQLAVAASLADAGTEVVGVFDASGISEGLTKLPSAIFGQWNKISEFAHYTQSLIRHRVPLYTQQTVLKAIGNQQDGVQSVIVGKLDAEGYPIAGTEKHYDVDLVSVSYGFMPATALTLHLGCDHRFDEHLAAYVPEHDATMQTSLAGVYVAGDMTGVGGNVLAELQGKVAGISALASLGIVPEQQAERVRAGLASQIAREHRFANFLWQKWRIKPGFWSIADEDTLICRCEGVTNSQLHQSYEVGAKNLQGVKLRTRMGMGICQGRYCSTNGSIIMAQKLGCSVHDIGLQSIRPPVVPVQLGDIVAAHEQK